MSTSPTTYDLLMQADRLLLDLQDAGGELTEEAEAAWAAWLKAGGGKLESLHAVAQRCTMQSVFLKAEEERLAKRRKALEGVKERVKALGQEIVVSHHNLTGETAIKTPTFTAWLQSSSRVVGPEDVNLWPEGYRRTQTTVSPDKEKAKEALRRGEAVEGVKLEPTTTLQWR